jgi:hypothetical protein
MAKPKNPASIPVSSKNDELSYNKASAGEKFKAMGGSDLIYRKFYGVDRND